MELEYETERSHEGLTPPGGAGQARPLQWVVWPPQPSPRPLLPPTYTLWPENIGGSAFFQDRVPLRHDGAVMVCEINEVNDRPVGKPQELGVMNIVASFSLNKKPR
jgi:hypothetical protein